ncbi:MAG: Coenzyme F420 hydrogenase/dehydrogenase, beta subunit C-terminal domain [Gammaproteobacteria bacterium]|nr:MAG: coenzyme F420 hydrogenase [Gammaproteobacteria bacterium]UCH41149.1 MAG: Coenzyme F420 hydrogenase/dehydrogenase, beta subunit C-terminal domain [Gammaproteobacteria bacterium]
MGQNPTPGERLYAIVEQGLCIGCGLCQAVAGADRVRVCKTLNGYEQPVVQGELDDATVDRIYAVCPGTRIEGLPERLIEADSKHDNVWGTWRRIVRAWAADPEIRFEGSTGGVLTALGIYLLESKRVDFILQVKTSNSEPSFGERCLSFTAADVIEAAGSRYGPAAPLIDIDEVLERDQPFAFIAKPCDVAALRNYAEQDSRVNELVKYWLVMVCGGYGTPQGTNDFFRRSGIEPEQVTGLRYRGRGCPGPTRVETADGSVQEFHYIDYWGEDETTWTLPFRCKICPDGIGEAADLAAADSWIGGGPDRVDSETDAGTNAIIARTRAGEELLAAAAADGALTIEYDIVPHTMSLYQPHQVNKKYAAWARHQGLGDAGHIVPQTARLRIEELARELPDETNEFQRKGTVERVEIGKATEPTPKIWKPDRD